MAYSNPKQMPNNAMGNPGGGKWGSVDDCLNAVVTDFKAWEAYHNTAEQCTVKLDYRGLARFHEKMAEQAQFDYEKLGKCVSDKPFGIITTLDYGMIAKASEQAHYNEQQLMPHLDMWSKALWDSRALITDAAYYLSDCHEITLYQKMCCYVKYIENYLWAVGVTKDRLTPSAINHPDAYDVFRTLHIYFKDCFHVGDMIDFDL
jgi:hypothetical protein